MLTYTRLSADSSRVRCDDRTKRKRHVLGGCAACSGHCCHKCRPETLSRCISPIRLLHPTTISPTTSLHVFIASFQQSTESVADQVTIIVPWLGGQVFVSRCQDARDNPPPQAVLSDAIACPGYIRVTLDSYAKKLHMERSLSAGISMRESLQDAFIGQHC
jgi:hypothetical protein